VKRRRPVPATSREGPQAARLAPAPGRSTSTRGLPFRSPRLQLDEGFRRLECRAGLGPAPEVDHGDLLHAGDRAARGAGLVGKELVLEVGWCVLVERDGGVAPLLRTVVDQPVFADVEVAAAGAAA